MATSPKTIAHRPRPSWLHKRLPSSGNIEATRRLLADLHLNTVCQSALCPNQGECFARGTATFMILGNNCTRNCRFCAVEHGQPMAVDADEPGRVAEAALRLGLKHVVVTSVTRDDLPDGGAAHFAATITALRKTLPGAYIEVLTPDFQGSREALATVAGAKPDIFNHNVETVPRLYPFVRPQADYRRSLAVLQQIKELNPTIYTKSGLMVGLGESREEVLEVMTDLR
ncbi:MAG: lipoyl synthase, partial [Moorella sp. (in: Bacteria)]|nr:lipoyl synthase [Moorella sp. (in: firmicutes)]